MARSTENFVMVEGNISWGPELRQTNTGKAVADFGLAQNDSIPDGKGGFNERSHFFTVTVWEALAENVAESLQKGSRVVVTGRLKYDEWEKDGVKNSKVTIVADTVSPSLRWATADVTRNEKGARRTGGTHIPDDELESILDAGV